MTNADRIRVMTDEELATWIKENIDCNKEEIMCSPEPYKNSGKCNGKCIDGRLNWLMQEHEVTMNDNELVNALRTEHQHRLMYTGTARLMGAAADAIEALQADLDESQRKVKDARNELCLKCGRYREAHNGACDGCKWKEN